MEQDPQGQQNARDDSARPAWAEHANSLLTSESTGNVFLAIHHHHHHHTERPRSPVRRRSGQIPVEDEVFFHEFQSRRREEVRLEAFIRDLDTELSQATITGTVAAADRPTWSHLPFGQSRSPIQLLTPGVGPEGRYPDDNTPLGNPRRDADDDARARAEAVEGELPYNPRGNYPPAGRQEMVSRSLVGARNEIKNLLIITALRIRLIWDGVSVESAWDALVAKFIRDEVFRSDQEVQNAFRFAFRQEPRDAFEPIIRGEVEAMHSAWLNQ